MFYKYEVSWYNSYTNEEERSKGIVIGHDYGSAANHVIESYGKDEVFELYLKEIVTDGGDEDCCLSEDDIKFAFEEE